LGAVDETTAVLRNASAGGGRVKHWQAIGIKP